MMAMKPRMKKTMMRGDRKKMTKGRSVAGGKTVAKGKTRK